MNCLLCDKKIEKYTLYSLFIEDSLLCNECLIALNQKRETYKLDDIEIEYYYHYDSLFKDLLLQYKECFDEALKDVFLYRIKEKIYLKYRKYKILYVPSSKEKLKQRGFNHLELIFEDLKLPKVEGLIMKEDLIQEGKNYNERLKMKNNYIYTGQPLDKVLIVDDVITTGSSIKGVYKTIKPYAKDIKILVLAKR